MLLMRASTERSSKPQVVGPLLVGQEKENVDGVCEPGLQRSRNSQAGRGATETAKSTAEGARSMGEEIADVSAMASNQYSRW